MDVLKDYDNADTISIDTLDPEEEEKHLQTKRAHEITELNSLSKKVRYLHSNLLYHRDLKTEEGAVCYEAWKALVKNIGGSPNTWKEVGCMLGIAQSDINYIKNIVKEDPTDTMLQVYMQNDRATLDKILEALVKLQRYDILRSIEKQFTDLALVLNRNDSGYNSNSVGKKAIMMRSNIPIDLPPALCNKVVLKEKDPNKPNLKPSMKKYERQLQNDKPILFLTFSEDGTRTANNIKYDVDNWTDMAGVQVIMLNDRKEEVYQNPEKFIREYFEKADFIVPIVTSKYLEDINSHRPNMPNTSDDLDSKYVSYIYNIIVTNYIHANGCMNKKVRSVIPMDVNVDVLMNITLYPDLMPWTYEGSFETQFKAFLKHKEQQS